MFAYLSKKIGMPKKQNIVMSICWNQQHGWVACGGQQGLLKVLKLDSGKGQGGGNLSMNQNLQGHSGTTRVVVWNQNYYKLTTSDDSGLIIVWMLHKPPNNKTQWLQQMINNRNKSTVRDMKWTPDGQKICIVYEDGAVIVGSVAGHRLWGKDLDFSLSSVEWSPDGRTILFGTMEGSVHVFDYVGNYLIPVKIACLDKQDQGEVPLAGIQWYDTSKINYLSYDVNQDTSTLAIAYSNGKMQFMCNQTDPSPTIVDTGMRITQIRWSPNGNILAVAGSIKDSSNTQSINEAGLLAGTSGVVQFYSGRGHHVRTLKVPSTRGIVQAISWEGFGQRLAIGADSAILFANIQPEYLWCYFSNTVVFAYRKPDRSELSVVFWDTNIDEKHVKIVKRLDKVVTSGGDYCLLVSSNPKPGENPNEIRKNLASNSTSLYSGQTWVLQLCNGVGSPIDSKVITIEPLFVAMNLTHVVVCNHDTIYVWQYRQVKNKSIPLQKINYRKAAGNNNSIANMIGKKSKSRGEMNEYAFGVDEKPSLQRSLYDKDRYYNRTAVGNVPLDAICSIAAGDDYFAVARGNGVLQQYSLIPLSKQRTIQLKCKPQHMEFNCNATRLAVIDIFGLFSLYDLNAAASGAADGGYIATERKDVWNIVWASDKPQSLAIMEKNRLYVMHGAQSEEAVLTSAYLCQFKDLIVKTILLEDVMKSPEQLKNIGTMVQEFETSALKEAREFLNQTAHTKKEQLAQIESKSHPRLWQLMAEHMLDKLDLSMAQNAFVKAKDYRGVLFVQKLQSISDKNKQKAEIAAYFKRFDEAEQIYKDIDRKDLALELRMRIGDWNKVISLIDQGAGDDQLLKIAHNNLGDYWAERQRWKKAAHFYSLAQNTEALIEAYYREEDFQAMEKLIEVLPQNSPLLQVLAQRFQSVGLAEGAVRALKKLGDVKRAVDVCVLLNYWDLAVELAENHNFVQIQGLLAKYAGHLMQQNKQMQAIQLYRKANKNTDAAKLLSKIADDLNSKGVPPLLVKKIYVLAALQVDSYKQRVLNQEMSQITGQAIGGTQATLNSLITTDINTSADKALSNPWKGAQAFHFYLLTNRHFYQKEYKKALKTSIRLKEYEKQLGAKTVYGLIALAAYLNHSYHECSKALVKLERLPENEITMGERMKYEELAINIFSRHPPQDGQKIMFRCPKCQAQVNEYDIACEGCGAYFSPCIASGGSILTRGYAQCKRCKKKMIMNEIKGLKLRNCPLCHDKLEQLEELNNQVD